MWGSRYAVSCKAPASSKCGARFESIDGHCILTCERHHSRVRPQRNTMHDVAPFLPSAALRHCLICGSLSLSTLSLARAQRSPAHCSCSSNTKGAHCLMLCFVLDGATPTSVWFEQVAPGESASCGGWTDVTGTPLQERVPVPVQRIRAPVCVRLIVQIHLTPVRNLQFNTSRIQC